MVTGEGNLTFTGPLCAPDNVIRGRKRFLSSRLYTLTWGRRRHACFADEEVGSGLSGTA